MHDNLGHKAVYRILKFEDPDGSVAEALRNGADLIAHAKEVDEFKENILLDEGKNEIWKLVIGSSSNVFDSTGAEIGVGDGTDAEDASQTDLTGTNKEYVSMDSGYPTVSGSTVTFRSTFDGSTANFSWQEFTVRQSTSLINLNRKVADKGTKSSGETWTVEIQITLS